MADDNKQVTDGSLDFLIYDGCGGEVRGQDGSAKGSVRPTSDTPKVVKSQQTDR